MSELDNLEYEIEIAKLDNVAFLVSKPGSDMTPKELADNGLRGNILDTLGNTIPILRMLEDSKRKQQVSNDVR